MNKNYRKAIIFGILLVIAAFFLMGATQPVKAAFGLDTGVKQVKTADSPAVYYLDYKLGRKKAYVNEAAFLSYNNRWSEVKTVSAEELAQWPEIRLVKTNDDPRVYYIADGQKYWVQSEQEFIDFGFGWDEIAIINAQDLAQYRSVDNIDALSAVKAGGGSGPQLEVSVKQSGQGNYIPLGTEDNLMATFNLKANGGLVKIIGLTFKIGGVFNTAAIEKLYLRDRNDQTYEFKATINNQQAYFNLASRPLVLAAGAEKNIEIFVNLSGQVDVVNSLFYLYLDNVSQINTEAAVSGVFPLQSPALKLVDGSGYLGRIKTEEESLAAIGQEAVIGNTERLLGKYKVSEITGHEDALITKIIFTNNGTVRDFEINNFKLKDGNGNVIAQTSDLYDNEITFSLDDYQIKKKDYQYFEVYGDIVGGEDKTIDLDVKTIKARGEDYSFGLLTDIVNREESLTISREFLGVIAKDLKSNNKVFKEESGSLIGLFEIRSDNRPVTLEDMEVSLWRSADAPGLDSTLYLINYQTGEVLNYLDGGTLNSGTAVIGLGELKLKAQDEFDLAFVTQLPAAAANGDSYRLVVNNIIYRAENSEYYSDEVNVQGKILNVNLSKLYVYANSEDQDLFYGKGEKKAKIASFIAESSAGENIRINSITIVQADGSGSITYDNGFSNLKLYIGAKQVGQTIAKPYGSSYTFSGFSYKLAGSKSVEIKVYADISSGAQTSTVRLVISDLAAWGYDSGIETDVYGLDVASPEVTLGEIKAAVTAVAGGNVAIGADDNVVAGFKIKNNGDETLKLNYLNIYTTTDGFSASRGYGNLRVVDYATGKKVGSKISKPVAGANKLKLGGYNIEPNEEIIFNVYVDAAANVPLETFQVYFGQLEVQGKISKIKTVIYDQTVKVTVSSGYDYAPPSPDDDIDDNPIIEVGFIMPVAGEITYGFHDPDYPFADSFEHTGIDIAVPVGTPVKAAAGGTVVSMVDGGSDYYYIAIKHNNNFISVYGHLSAVNVLPGQTVEQGEVIGLSGGEPGEPGSGPYTTGAHLHFEIQLNGLPVDPEDYLE